jgi:hypothetical protein
VRILVCGSRHFGKTRAELIAFARAMIKLHKKHGKDIQFIHGGADGADTLVDAWIEVLGLRTALVFGVTKEEWRRIGPSAGPKRNQRMLDEGKPDAGVAFPGGRGTADMCQRLEAAGLKVWRPYG